MAISSSPLANLVCSPVSTSSTVPVNPRASVGVESRTTNAPLHTQVKNMRFLPSGACMFREIFVGVLLGCV